MAVQSQFQRFLARLLVFCVLIGAGLPPSALWRCDHAARLIAAPLPMSRAAMPCQGMPGEMPCCHPAAPLAKGNKFATGAPPCKPSVQAATLPVVRLEACASIQCAPSSAEALAPFVPDAPRPSLTGPLRRRSSPPLGLRSSDSVHPSSPRAPPVA